MRRNFLNNGVQCRHAKDCSIYNELLEVAEAFPLGTTVTAVKDIPDMPEVNGDSIVETAQVQCLGFSEWQVCRGVVNLLNADQEVLKRL